MPVCGIVGCSRRQGEEIGIRFFKVPKIIKGQGEETQKLSEERRMVWKSAINRKDITTEDKWDRTLVCSLHFVGETKAYLHDRTNPSWAPTINLGYSQRASTPQINSDRFRRAKQRKEKRKISDAVSSLLNLKKVRLELDNERQENTETNNDCLSESNTGLDNDDQPTLAHETDCEAEEYVNNTKDTQTQLTGQVIEQIVADNRARVAELEGNDKAGCKRQGLYRFETYEIDPSKAIFYTGLPSIDVIKLVFELVKCQMSNNFRSLTKENQFMLCLIRLRMNYTFQDIADQLNVSQATVQRSFHATLDVLYARLGFLVNWPEREDLRESMPMVFRKGFGEKVCIVLDCFELRIEKPSGALSKVFTYSNYKRSHTVKYLLGMAPQGVVTWISEGWGGRTSDKHVTEDSTLLENLLPGDIVMVDRGFLIDESVNFYQASVARPGFTRGHPQLQPLEVENTRSIANVRIHVERIIGLVCRKFKIFESIIPIEFLKLKKGENVPTIDKIVKVCCCLTNLCQSVVPFD